MHGLWHMIYQQYDARQGTEQGQGQRARHGGQGGQKVVFLFGGQQVDRDVLYCLYITLYSDHLY